MVAERAKPAQVTSLGVQKATIADEEEEGVRPPLHLLSPKGPRTPNPEP